MAAKAKAEITLSRIVDIASITRYYKLQASTATAPATPTAAPPSGWTTTEPGYTSGSTQTLYCVELTRFTNGTWSYSAVSKSSSYEAAKAAYAKANSVEGELKLYVKQDDNDQIVSMINASANQIALKSNRLTIDSDNFTLAADGSVTATGANLRGELFLDNGVHIKQAPTAAGEAADEYCTAWQAEDGWAHTSFLATPMTTHFKEDVMIDGDLYYKDNGTPVADMVIEQGTSDIWTYRKWASGTAECWGIQSYGNMPLDGVKWGAWYASKNSYTIQFPPRLFVDIPVFTAEYISSAEGAPFGMIAHGWFGITKDRSLGIRFVSAESKTLPNCMAAVRAIGRWK